MVNGTIPFLEFVGVADGDIQTYADYYYTINPYERYWRNHKDGKVWISDYVLPVSELGQDEFYNDWMSKIGDYDSAIGVKLNATAENEVRFNLMFPTRYFDQYIGPADQVISRLRGR